MRSVLVAALALATITTPVSMSTALAGVAAAASGEQARSTATATATATVPPVSAATVTGTAVGAWSRDWADFDLAVGPVAVYRGYDDGFHYPTWQQVPLRLAHPGGMNDYSFHLPPAEVAAGLHDAALNTFISSTPTNITLTNWHEPEQEIASGAFTASAFRKAQAHLNALVDAQNLIDGGTRRVSVVLMCSTFTGYVGRNPEDYWPTVAKGDGGSVDLISTDAYAKPHATNTAGVPAGYTDGINWKNPSAVLKPTLVFAKQHSTDWAVSELGYLEDVHDPMRKADALRAAVAYAKAGKATPTAAAYRPALWISYWDSAGTRADWRLRHNGPLFPSIAIDSNAIQAWKEMANPVS